MISLSAAATSVLTGSYTAHVAIESWRGDQLLTDAVPVVDGSAVEDVDRILRVPERLTLRVPAYDRGMSWSPAGDDDHPLSASGQRLRVSLGIGLAHGVVEWFTRGEFLVMDTVPAGDDVAVTAVGLLQLVDEARLVTPYQPTGTLVSTLRGLVEPALTVSVDAALADRAVPGGINYDEDRLGAVLELLDAWPADAVVDPEGFLAVRSVDQAVEPVLALTDGVGGTVLRAPGASTRDGGVNAVVARGTAADGGQVQAVAYDLSGGPTSWGGPFNPLPVPYAFASPLLTTVPQCRAAAATVLARLARSAGQVFDVEMVPHPALQVGDAVTLTTAEVTAKPCVVERLRLPYGAGGGPATARVRSLR